MGSQHNSRLFPEMNDNKSRKSTAACTYRILRSPKELAANRMIGYPQTDSYSNKVSSKNSNSILKSVAPEDIAKDCSVKIETSSMKSSIPTSRRLATPTLIPRVVRAVSATGRLPSLDLGVNCANFTPVASNLKNSLSKIN